MTDLRLTVPSDELAPMVTEAASILAKLITAALQAKVTENASESQIAAAFQLIAQRTSVPDVVVDRPASQVLVDYVDLVDAVKELSTQIPQDDALAACTAVNATLESYLDLSQDDICRGMVDMRHYPSPTDEAGMRLYASVAGATEILSDVLTSMQELKLPKPELNSGAYLPPDPCLIVATAQTEASIRTSILASLGENEAFKQAVQQGEIPLLAPGKTNVGGPDFVTIVENDGNYLWIVIYDAKTSSVPVFKPPKEAYPATWDAEIEASIGSLKTVAPDLYSKLDEAWRADRIEFRQVNVDLSPQKPGDPWEREPERA